MVCSRWRARNAEPLFGLLGGPAAAGGGPVGGGDERVEQVRFETAARSGRPQSSGRVAQGPGAPRRGQGVVDGAGQGDHQRRAQRLPGRGLRCPSSASTGSQRARTSGPGTSSRR